jgi:outer membrane protein assembly factor BamB
MWGFATHPVVLGDKLIMTVGPVLCFNKTTGDLLWKSGADKAGYSSAAIFKYKDKTLIATMVEAGLLVVDAADGKEVARFPWPTTPYRVHVVTPIIEGNRIFISSGYGMGGAVVELGDDGLKEIWRTKDMKNHAANCILYKGYLYGFDGQVNEGPLTCLDFKTGQKKWAQDDIRAGSLMLADGKLLIMSSKGDLIVAEAKPESFNELGRVHVLDSSTECWTMPVLSGGRVFCRNRGGDLVCLSVGGK